MFTNANDWLEGAVANFSEPMKYQGEFAYEMGNVAWHPKTGFEGIKSVYKTNGLMPFAGGALSMGLSGGTGFLANGLPGAAAGLAVDFGVGAASRKWHYQQGIGKAAEADMLRPGLVSTGLKKMWGGAGQIPSGISVGTRAYNTAAFAGKAIGGNVFGTLGATMLGRVGGHFGGTMGEVTGNVVGGFVGARLGFAATAAVGGAMFTPVGMFAGGVAAATVATAAVGAGAAYGGYKTLQAGYRYRQNQKNINTSGDLAAFATSGAYTMRSRAVQAIHKSHLNARSAIGQEASLMHMPQKNYHSNYRKFY